MCIMCANELQLSSGHQLQMNTVSPDVLQLFGVISYGTMIFTQSVQLRRIIYGIYWAQHLLFFLFQPGLLLLCPTDGFL